MTAEQKYQIESLRKQGIGYATVAKELGLAKSTVSNYCRSHGLAGYRAVDKATAEPATDEGKKGKKKQKIVPKVTVTFAKEPNPEALRDALRILLNVKG